MMSFLHDVITLGTPHCNAAVGDEGEGAGNIGGSPELTWGLGAQIVLLTNMATI